jgi:hypothetical protein
MKSNARVLIVSRDEALLRTRELIIGAYFNTIGVGTPSEAKAQLRTERFHLMVLCHSLRSNEAENLAELAHRQEPPAKVLALRPRTDIGEPRPWADEVIGVDAGPFALLVKSADILNFRIRSKAKPVCRV